MITITAKLIDTKDEQELLEQFGLERGGRVQRAIDQSVIDYCRPYVPASPDRALEFSAYSTGGKVIWDTPYAHYQYAGIVYGPNIPIMQDGVLMRWFSPPGRKKYRTDRKLTYDTGQNKQAGSHWFERMKADRLNDILDVARHAMNEGG